MNEVFHRAVFRFLIYQSFLFKVDNQKRFAFHFLSKDVTHKKRCLTMLDQLDSIPVMISGNKSKI